MKYLIVLLVLLTSCAQPQKGFILKNIGPESVYQKIGFRNGDVIIEINGNKIQSNTDLKQELKNVKTIKLIRNGETKILNFTH